MNYEIRCKGRLILETESLKHALLIFHQMWIYTTKTDLKLWQIGEKTREIIAESVD
jgi:hypothetical protein